MPRHKQTVTRDHQLNLGFTLAEYELLSRRADAVGLPLFRYARSVLLNEKITPVVAASASRLDPLAYQQWIRVGSNLNQLARQLNAMQSASAGEVEAVLFDIRQLIRSARE